MQRIRTWFSKPLSWLIIGCAAILLLIIFTITDALYWNWNYSGFGPKTLWDWMELLIVPLVLAIGGFIYNRTEKRTEMDIAEQRTQDALLQSCLDQITALLLHEHTPLRKSEPESEVRSVARARTLTVLQRLDGSRKRSVLQFLYEANLITKEKTIVSLVGADLEEADLVGASLKGANLEGTILRRAILHLAKLEDANLERANLARANLKRANLQFANLKRANLNYANLDSAHLNHANLFGASFQESIMIQTHLEGANLEEAMFYKTNLQTIHYTTQEQFDKAFIHPYTQLPDWSPQSASPPHSIDTTAQQSPAPKPDQPTE